MFTRLGIAPDFTVTGSKLQSRLFTLYVPEYFKKTSERKQNGKTKTKSCAYLGELGQDGGARGL